MFLIIHLLSVLKYTFRVNFGDYSKVLDGNATINKYSVDPYFYIPNTFYDTIMKTLGARQQGFMYGVPCDNARFVFY